MATTALLAQLNGYGLIAGARSDFMPAGPEYEAMSEAAIKAHALAQAIERGEHFTPDSFTATAREIDALMAQAGARRLPARADEWTALFTA